MPDSLCRLTVQRGGDAVDLALPRQMYVGQLMTSIVDIVHRDSAAPAIGGRWRLSRAGGPPLDESMTLDENEIRDGALLLLTTVEHPGPEWVAGNPSHIVAQVDNASGGQVLKVLPVIGCLIMTVVSAATLVWSAMVTATGGHLVAGAGLATAAAVSAVVARRAHPDALLCVTLSVTAVIFTAVVGILAVPVGQPAAHALLASAAAFAVTILLIRLIGCGTLYLTAIATISILTAAVAAAGVAWQLPTDAAGAALATLSLAALGVAPRFSIVVTGISPPAPSADDPVEPATDAVEARAAFAHQTLTGMVMGSSGSAALGAALVAVGDIRDRALSPGAVAFTAVIAVVLLLRARTHADATRRIALAAGGLVSTTAGFAIGVVSAPEQAHWMSLLAGAAGIGALSPLFGVAVSPVVRRAVELFEYLALAAVVPLACWVGGLYGLVRGTGLI